MSQSHNENPFFGALDSSEQNPSSSAQNQFNDPFSLQEPLPQENIPPAQKPNNPNDGGVNETIRNLQEICPTVDREIIEVILQNNDNNFEAALNELLALSDPSYVPPQKNPNPSNNQVLSDEEYAKALQAEEQPPTNDQTKADEDYARAILAAEQGHLEDIERLRMDSLAQSGMMPDSRPSPRLSSSESKNNGISTLVEKSKKKFAGLFGRNSKDSDSYSVSDQPLSSQQRDSYSRFEDDRDSLYDVHQEVLLERRETSPNHEQNFSQPSQPNHRGNAAKANLDLLGDDPPENMQPINPVSSFNRPTAYSGSSSHSPPNLFDTTQNQSPPQSQRPVQVNPNPPAVPSNNPFNQDLFSTNQSQSAHRPPKNPFE